jgi:hypothetical protein
MSCASAAFPASRNVTHRSLPERYGPMKYAHAQVLCLSGVNWLDVCSAVCIPATQTWALDAQAVGKGLQARKARGTGSTAEDRSPEARLQIQPVTDAQAFRNGWHARKARDTTEKEIPIGQVFASDKLQIHCGARQTQPHSLYRLPPCLVCRIRRQRRKPA